MLRTSSWFLPQCCAFWAILLSCALVMAACTHRPTPDGRTGIDFDIHVEEAGLDALLARLGTPTSSGEQAALVAGWLLSVRQRDSGDRPLPFTTQVRLSVLDEERRVITTRRLQWGDNQWYQRLIPGTYRVTITISGTRGSAELASPPMTLADGERLNAEFPLSPPDDRAAPPR